MTQKRKIAIFTGNRAEYGLQFPIISAISKDPRFDHKLLVSGAHLKQDFGRTLQEIKDNGFEIAAEVRIDMPDDTLVATAQAIGTGVVSTSRVLAELKPDIFVVYADRFESFAAIIAGTQMGIPTAHVEGGDYTEGGALDDSVRHAMTKLAHLHFTTNEQAAERVRRLGEEPWRVHNVGFPALDLVRAGNYAKAEEVYAKYNLSPDKAIVVFTQHSVTTEFEDAPAQIRPSLAALEHAAREWGVQVILTYPNDDAGGKRIVHELETFMQKKVPGIQLHANLGRFNYHGVLGVAAACAGNSSSGIKETPAFHCTCIDIGSRQRGRLRADNVIETGYDEKEITEAIHKSIFDDAWKAHVRAAKNPYGAGDAGPRIAEVLATVPLDRTLVQKKMTY